MLFPKIGKRAVRIAIAVFFSIFIHIFLLIANKTFGYETSDFAAPSNIYTPFFAAIAAAYALHKDNKGNYEQAKIRSIGSLIGGYYGMVVILLTDFILINLLDLQTKNYILYQMLLFIIVAVTIVPLIKITVALKQHSALFITCLTFLSVTISIRNGGLPVALFATNRILSTIIGIGISLLINRLALINRKNKNVLFVTSLDNNILADKKHTISPYVKYELTDLYLQKMPLAFVTTRTLSSLEYIFDDVKINFPLVVMNGAATYHFENREYDKVCNMDKESTEYVNQILIDNNINAFIFSIDDNMLYCFFKSLNNEGEKHYYNSRKKYNFDNFIKTSLPENFYPSLYIIIETKENIDKVVEYINNSSCIDKVDLVIEPYKEVSGEYCCLKINSKEATKESLIRSIKQEGNYSKLVVCASETSDIPLIKEADYSFCLKTAHSYIKDEVDSVISASPEDILKIFETIYHSKNIDRTISKIKKKYKKKN